MLKIDLTSVIASATEIFPHEVLHLSGDLFSYYYVDFLRNKLNNISPSSAKNLQCDINLILLGLGSKAGDEIHGCYLCLMQLVNCLVFLKNQAIQLNEDEIFTPQDVESDLNTWTDGLKQFCNCLKSLSSLSPNVTFTLDIYHVLSHSEEMFKDVISNEVYEIIIHRYFPSYIPICHCSPLKCPGNDVNIEKNFYAAISLLLNLKEQLPLPKLFRMMQENFFQLFKPLMKCSGTNTKLKCKELNLLLQNDEKYKHHILDDKSRASVISDYESLREFYLNHSVIPHESSLTNIDSNYSDCSVEGIVVESECNNSQTERNDSLSQMNQLPRKIRHSTLTVTEDDLESIHGSEHGDANKTLTQDLPQLSLGILLNNSLLNFTQQNEVEEHAHPISELLNTSNIENGILAEAKLPEKPTKGSDSLLLSESNNEIIEDLPQMSLGILLDNSLINESLQADVDEYESLSIDQNTLTKQITLPQADIGPNSDKSDNRPIIEENSTSENIENPVGMSTQVQSAAMNSCSNKIDSNNAIEDLPQISLGILSQNSLLNSPINSSIDSQRNFHQSIPIQQCESDNFFDEDNRISTDELPKQISSIDQKIHCVENGSNIIKSSTVLKKSNKRKLYNPNKNGLLCETPKENKVRRKDSKDKHSSPSTSKNYSSENSFNAMENTSTNDEENHSSKNKTTIRTLRKTTLGLEKKCPQSGLESRKIFPRVELSRLSVFEMTKNLRGFHISIQKLPDSLIEHYKTWDPKPLKESRNNLTENPLKNVSNLTNDDNILPENASENHTESFHFSKPVDNVNKKLGQNQRNTACVKNALGNNSAINFSEDMVLNSEDTVLITDDITNSKCVRTSTFNSHLGDRGYLSDDTLPIDRNLWSTSHSEISRSKYSSDDNDDDDNYDDDWNSKTIPKNKASLIKETDRLLKYKTKTKSSMKNSLVKCATSNYTVPIAKSTTNLGSDSSNSSGDDENFKMITRNLRSIKGVVPESSVLNSRNTVLHKRGRNNETVMLRTSAKNKFKEEKPCNNGVSYNLNSDSNLTDQENDKINQNNQLRKGRNSLRNLRSDKNETHSKNPTSNSHERPKRQTHKNSHVTDVPSTSSNIIGSESETNDETDGPVKSITKIKRRPHVISVAPTSSRTGSPRKETNNENGQNKWINKDEALFNKNNECGKRSPWTDEEEEKLVLGVQKFGKGSWVKIIKDFKISRSSQQLYDKWRNLEKYNCLQVVEMRLKTKMNKA